jgi:hypothetical protein
MHEQLARVGGHIDGVFFRRLKRDLDLDRVETDVDLLPEIGSRFGLPLSDVPVVASTEDEFDPVMKIGARPILVKNRLNDNSNNNTTKGNCERFESLAHAVDALVAETSR